MLKKTEKKREGKREKKTEGRKKMRQGDDDRDIEPERRRT